jgi:hypothetical protein
MGIPNQWLKSWRDHDVKTIVGPEVISLVKNVLSMKNL